LIASQHSFGLDRVRAFAILMVVAGHYSLEFFRPRESLTVLMMGLATGGVILFFLLSGYLIQKSSESSSAITFLVRRLCKIYPAYWVSILVIISLMIYSGSPVDPKSIVGNLLMMQDILNVGYLNNVFWSLLIEIKYYFLVSVVRVLRLKKVFYLAPYLFFIINCSLYFTIDKISTLLLWLPVFFIGMEIYNCHVKLWDKKSGARLSGIIFLTVINLIVFYDYGASIAVFFLIVGIALILTANLFNAISQYLKFIATISYSWYLYHTSVGYPLGHWLLTHNLGVVYVVGLVVLISILLAFFSYRYIETFGIKIGDTLNIYLNRVF